METIDTVRPAAEGSPAGAAGGGRGARRILDIHAPGGMGGAERVVQLLVARAARARLAERFGAAAWVDRYREVYRSIPGRRR